MRLNLPNQITVSRLILAIIFFALLAQFDLRRAEPWIINTCLVLFVVAALTDWLDGYLARKHNQVTTMGRVLDPFVDKVLACGAFTLFVGTGFVDASGQNITSVAPWMVVLIFGREVLVTDLRGFAEAHGLAFGADVFGKAKNWSQMITATYILFYTAVAGDTVPGQWLSGVKLALIWIVLACTFLSGMNYLIKARGLIARSAEPST